MSAPADPGLEPKKTGLHRMLSRIKTVLKKNDGSKRLSFSKSASTATATATTSTSADPSTSKALKSIPASVPVEPHMPGVEPTTSPGGPELTKVLRSQIDTERARKLGERFNITFQAHDLLLSSPDKVIYRVEKMVRMRIHRQCHICSTTFGFNKVCASCQHTRCSKCNRHPLKKYSGRDKENESPGATAMAGHKIEADTYYGTRETFALMTMPSKTGGQALVRKKPLQRVRRTCHECSTLFSGGTKTCSNCGHVRCTDCPQDPPKKKRFPDGYPGDAYSTSLLPLKYSCHRCSEVFSAIPHPSSAEGIALAASDPAPPAPECAQCGHRKCHECPRAPIVQIESAPDPEIMRRVEARLAALNIGAEEGAAL